RPPGCIVWREVAQRTAAEEGAQWPGPAGGAAPAAGAHLTPVPPMPPLSPAAEAASAPAARRAARLWRVARPDLFSIRHTTVPAYLRPMVHEVKASRADLLSGLRHAPKRRAHQWLGREGHYVFRAGLAAPEGPPPDFRVAVR